jgi:hypothetical protein
MGLAPSPGLMQQAEGDLRLCRKRRVRERRCWYPQRQGRVT